MGEVVVKGPLTRDLYVGIRHADCIDLAAESTLAALPHPNNEAVVVDEQGVPWGMAGVETSQYQEQDAEAGDAPDRMTKLAELVNYFHTVSGMVHPDGDPSGIQAFEMAAYCVQAIIDGRLDDLPWGIAAS
jgi:hypothetical protein